jgi:hypothetical protein
LSPDEAFEIVVTKTVEIEGEKTSLVRALGPLDATMIVIGSMIGSGIFIVSAESSRLSGAPGWLLLAWALAGLLLVAAARRATLPIRFSFDARINYVCLQNQRNNKWQPELRLRRSEGSVPSRRLRAHRAKWRSR